MYPTDYLTTYNELTDALSDRVRSTKELVPGYSDKYVLDLQFGDNTSPLYLYSPNGGIIPKTTDSVAVLGNAYYPFDKVNSRQLILRSAVANTADITFTRSGWNYIRCTANDASNAIAFMPG